jgi:hypothetical protein
MAESRKRRIVKRAVWTLAAAVLLVSVYVSSYLGAWWLHGRMVISQPQLSQVRKTVFHPIEVHYRDCWPGCHYVRVMAMWCLLRGNGQSVTLEEVHIGLLGMSEERRQQLAP